MKVKDLIEMLQYEDGDMEVVFKPSNSSYVEAFDYGVQRREVTSFYGNDTECLVIKSDGQVGAV